MKPSGIWANHEKNMETYVERGDFREPWKFGTVIATMFVNDRKNIIAREYKALEDAGVKGVWRADEQDKNNLIHQRYTFHQWEVNNPDRPISEMDTILEVGAGYGASVIVASRMGFRGTYHIVDLPPMEIVQQEHLAFRGIKCRVVWEEIPRPDLFVAIASLSEIPVASRDPFLDRISPKSYLIGYQHVWELVDNRKYFDEWRIKVMTRGADRRSIRRSDLNQLEYLVSKEMS